MGANPLLATINCSIGNIKNHLNDKDLCNLFLKIKEKEHNLTILEKYAINVMQTEALPQEFLWFQKDFNIPQEYIQK
ncbi:hypothetical protein [Campylobacter sp. US33a]|uniref:hypothetical protein n=1 Tax=Campylobacter sp. US33a TaxID=2498120 RepID=UPI0010682B92|nr:hypothetical protein [Campylobacter sp. US33a]TEX99679.1 hypothetical protein ELQ16_09665 [Campylobacter sp. US33a]